MREKVKGALLAVVLVGGGAAGAGGSPSAAALKSAAFDVTAVHTGAGSQVAINSQVWITPKQARAEITHPLQGKLTFLVTNGYFYQLSDSEKRGIKQPLPPEFKKNPDNFRFLISTFTFDAASALNKAKKVRTETLSGYDCDVYNAKETHGESSRTITVWMPQKMEPKFPLKAILEETMSKPGATLSQTVTITLSHIRLNAPIPPSQWKVPAGYQIKAVSRPAAPKVSH